MAFAFDRSAAGFTYRNPREQSCVTPRPYKYFSPTVTGSSGLTAALGFSFSAGTAALAPAAAPGVAVPGAFSGVPTLLSGRLWPDPPAGSVAEPWALADGASGFPLTAAPAGPGVEAGSEVIGVDVAGAVPGAATEAEPAPLRAVPGVVPPLIAEGAVGSPPPAAPELTTPGCPFPPSAPATPDDPAVPSLAGEVPEPSAAAEAGALEPPSLGHPSFRQRSHPNPATSARVRIPRTRPRRDFGSSSAKR